MSIIGVGVDIERVDRFGPSRRLIERIFTPAEIDYCSSKSVPARNYAARFAAKEATVKALCTVLPNLLVTQVEVYKEDHSQIPLLRLINGPVLPDGITLHVSLSHTDDYATAFVVAEKSALPSTVG